MDSELLRNGCSDSTPDVTFTYDRLGNQATVADYVGTRTFTYHGSGPRLYEDFSAGSIYHASTTKRLRSQYQDQIVINTGEAVYTYTFPRLSNLAFGTTSSPTADYQATYAYDDANDRMNKVTGPGLPASGANYTYVQYSNLIAKTQFKSNSTTVKAEIERHYETNRDLVDWVENRWGSTPDQVSKYTYVNDAIGRRTSCVRTGNAFSASHHDVWGYNDRNELTTTTRRSGTTVGSGTHDYGPDRGYAYDPIGNRQNHTEGDSSNPTVKLYYCANDLNQYTTTDDDSPCPPSSAIESCTYDADGNLTESNNSGDIAPGTPARRVKYVWDAENRLIEVSPVSPQSGDKQVKFAYDYMGRRVEKKVSLHNGTSFSSTASSHIKYVWFNWLNILELNGLSSNAILRKYTWGLDLAGQSGSVNSLESAGGIGGLLSVQDTANSAYKYVYCYDANGNVVQLLDPAAANVSAAMVAKYEYDAYGNATSSSGSYRQRTHGGSVRSRGIPKRGWETGVIAGAEANGGFREIQSVNATRRCYMDSPASCQPTALNAFGLTSVQNLPLSGPITCGKCETSEPGACPPHYVPRKGSQRL